MLFESGTEDFKDILKILSTHIKLKERMKLICDVIEVSDEQRYKFNEVKLMDFLLSKLKRVKDHISQESKTFQQNDSYTTDSVISTHKLIITRHKHLDGSIVFPISNIIVLQKV